MTVGWSVGEKIHLELHSFDFVISQNFDGKYNMNPWTRSEAYIWFYRQRTDYKQIAVPSAVQRSVECQFHVSPVFLGTACQHFSFHCCPLQGKDRHVTTLF